MDWMNWIEIGFALFLLWGFFVYNIFIKLINNTAEAWADIDVQLKRRYDLIPNLVTLVKSYAKHESQVLEDLTNLRVKAMQAKTVKDKESAENALGAGLNKIMAVAENYPNLRASENFSKLQEELAGTENTIASARRYYNGNVRELNTKIESVPSNIIAMLFQFEKKDYFQANLEEKSTPQIKT